MVVAAILIFFDHLRTVKADNQKGSKATRFLIKILSQLPKKKKTFYNKNRLNMKFKGRKKNKPSK